MKKFLNMTYLLQKKFNKKIKKFSQFFYKVKVLDFSKIFIKIPSWIKYNETLIIIKIYEKKYIRLLPNKEFM